MSSRTLQVAVAVRAIIGTCLQEFALNLVLNKDSFLQVTIKKIHQSNGGRILLIRSKTFCA